MPPLNSPPPWPPQPLVPAYAVMDETITHDNERCEETVVARLVFCDWFDRRVAVLARRTHPLHEGNGGAVLHCVGGAQTIHPGDLAVWTRAGYAAASFDWQLTGVAQRPAELATQFPPELVPQFSPTSGHEAALLPVAIQAAAVCLDWLAHTPGVDPAKLGVVGISWGGYLTWLLAAHDPRVRAIVPVFGCGGLFEPGRTLAQHDPAVEKTWREHWDPAALGPRITAAILFLSGTNDFFGNPTVAEELLATVPAPTARHYLPNVDHSTCAAQTRLALAWMNRFLLKGRAVPTNPSLQADGCVTTDSTAVSDPITWWTEPQDRWLHRRWQCTPPPPDRVVLAFAQVAHADGLELSSPIRELTPKHPTLATPPPLPAPTRTLPIGLGWRWESGHTRLFNNDVTVQPSPTTPHAWVFQPTRPHDDDPVSVLVHIARPDREALHRNDTLRLGWTAVPQGAVRIMLHCNDATAVPIETEAPWADGQIEFTLGSWAAGTPGLAWRNVGRVQITAHQARAPFTVGPLTAISSSHDSRSRPN